MATPQASPETSAAIQRLPPEIGASLLDVWWHASSDPTFAHLITGLNSYLDAIPIPNPNHPPSGIPLGADAKADFWKGVVALKGHPAFANFVQRLIPYLEFLDKSEHTHLHTLNGSVEGIIEGDVFRQTPAVNGTHQVPSGCKRPIFEVDGARPASEYEGQTKKERLEC